MSTEADPAEPSWSIYGSEQWQTAKERVSTAPPESRRLFRELLARIEQGWRHLRALQRLYERERPGATVPEYVQLLEFVHEDVVDLFRTVVLDVADLVASPFEWRDADDMSDVHGDLLLFQRNLIVLRLAGGSELVPPAAARTIREAAAPVGAWPDEMLAILGEVDGTILRGSCASAAE